MVLALVSEGSIKNTKAIKLSLQINARDYKHKKRKTFASFWPKYVSNAPIFFETILDLFCEIFNHSTNN